MGLRRLCVVVSVLVLAGCGSSDPEPGPVPSSSVPTADAVPSASAEPSPTPSPSPSPSPTEWQSFPPAPEGESEEIAAIRAGWIEHEIQFDRFAKDPSLTQLTPLTNTMTDDYLLEVLDYLDALREENAMRIGHVSHRDVVVQAPERDESGRNMSKVEVCQDFTNQGMVNESGEDAAASEGQEWATTVRTTYLMQQLDDGRWAVAGERGVPEAC